MHIFLDEAGTFAVSQNLYSWCVVTALVMPEAAYVPAREMLRRFKVRHGAPSLREMKRRDLDENQYFAFLEGKAKPSTFTLSPPRGRIAGQTIVLSFEIPHDSKQDIRPELDRQLDEIEKHLGWVRNDVSGYNNIHAVAETAIRKRKERLLANQGRVAALSIPLKVRPNAPQTYAAPSIRKKVAPALPPASSRGRTCDE